MSVTVLFLVSMSYAAYIINGDFMIVYIFKLSLYAFINFSVFAQFSAAMRDGKCSPCDNCDVIASFKFAIILSIDVYNFFLRICKFYYIFRVVCQIRYYRFHRKEMLVHIFPSPVSHSLISHSYRDI